LYHKGRTSGARKKHQQKEGNRGGKPRGQKKERKKSCKEKENRRTVMRGKRGAEGIKK